MEDRTVGIWFLVGFYVAVGVYLLGFWASLARLAAHMFTLAVISIVIAISLYFMSRLALWLGLFIFPILLTEFLAALITSVNLEGWGPNPIAGAFQGSMLIYLILLCFSTILLVNKRVVLRPLGLSPFRSREIPPGKSSDTTARSR